MASKYDTNPLDPDFPKKAAHSAEPQRVVPSPKMNSAQTRQFAGPVAEEPTRRYDNANFAQYSAPYNEPQTNGQMYQTNQSAETEAPSSRKVNAVGLPENVLMVLPYTPFYIGLVASILELIFVPQSETKVRFHAAQGLAAHVAILLVTILLKIAAEFSGWADTGIKIFGLVTMIMLIVSMIRIWRGKAVHFASIDGLTDWIGDKIKPQNK